MANNFKRIISIPIHTIVKIIDKIKDLRREPDETSVDAGDIYNGKLRQDVGEALPQDSARQD
jgi:hypothetical protein